MVHAEHVELVAHVSELEPPHWLRTHAQLEHVPEVGPVEVPLTQLLVAPHQPQPARVEQVSHEVALPQVSVAIVWQRPDEQLRPSQQSPSVVQTSLPPRHAHTPPVQSMLPQHSAPEVHVWPASRQQSCVRGLARQLRPLQHSPSAVQVRPAAEHEPEASQRPLSLHDRPVAHAAPDAQQT